MDKRKVSIYSLTTLLKRIRLLPLYRRSHSGRISILRFAHFILLSLLLCSCKRSATPPSRPPPSVTANQPAQREVVEWDEYPGRLDAVDMVEVRARVNGYLESVNFKDGAEIKKGDLLFVIDPRPYQAE